MNDVSISATSLGDAAPPGFAPIRLGPNNGFVDVNGPLYSKIQDERLLLGFRVELRHCNPADVCHGGMLMTFADMLLGIGANYQAKLGRFLPTVNMSADFLAPAPLGAWVEGSVDVLRTTRNLVFAHCLLIADGVPAMRASGIMKLGPPFDANFQLFKPSI